MCDQPLPLYDCKFTIIHEHVQSYFGDRKVLVAIAFDDRKNKCTFADYNCSLISTYMCVHFPFFGAIAPKETSSQSKQTQVAVVAVVVVVKSCLLVVW